MIVLQKKLQGGSNCPPPPSRKRVKTNFWKFDHLQIFPGVTQGPRTNLDPFGSDVYWMQTNNQTTKYKYWFLFSAINICSVSNVVLHAKIYNYIYNSRHKYIFVLNSWMKESERSSFLGVLAQDMTEKSTYCFSHFESDWNGFAYFLFWVGT